MSFEPKTWRDYPNTTTPITAEELNRLEQGLYEASISLSDESLAETVAAPGSKTQREIQRAVLTTPDNLFNRKSATTGYMYPHGTDELEARTDHTVSNWIRVSPGEQYSFSPHTTRLTYFDVDRRYVHATALGSTTIQHTVPDGAAWMRVSVRNTDLDDYQINPGPVILPYTEGRDPYLGPENIVLPSNVSTARIRKSTNLVDARDRIDDRTIPINQGELESFPGYSVTNYIRVEPGGLYTGNYVFRYTWYDEDLNYVDSWSAVNPSTEPSTPTPRPGAYVRLTFVTNRANELQLVEGDELLEYEPWWLEIEGLRISDLTSSQSQIERPDPKLVDYFLLDTDGLSKEYTAPDLEDQNELHTTTTADIYSWFDQLVQEHPEYVSRQDLGPSSTSAYRMYSYTLTPTPVPDEDGLDTKPAAILISGVHGYEKASVYHNWKLAKELCENWESSPVLDALRWNVELVFIPVGSPYGYDTADRGTANGVDVARNFSADWVQTNPESVTYSGPEPLSEPETQAIDQVMQAYQDRAVFGTSFHNYTASEERSFSMIWSLAHSQLIYRVSKRLLARMSRKWRREREWVTDPTTYYGTVDWTAPRGSEGRQFLKYGIQGNTFEVSRLQRLDGINTRSRSKESMTLGYEAYVNFIAMGIEAGILDRNQY